MHRRRDNALAKTKPDLVIACYGMNDGIYHPLSQERFAKYQDGINRLVAKVHAAGDKAIMLTPPPFDPLPLKSKPGKLLPAGSTGYGWKGVCETYDDVIKTYADWILQNSAGADQVINVHTPMMRFLTNQRKSKPNYFLAGDGIHLKGHRIMAEAILAKWLMDVSKTPSADLVKLVRQKERLLHATWLSTLGHDRPGMKDGLPLDEALQKAAALNAKLTAL